MRDDVLDSGPINPRLPDVIGFVVLLGAQRGMVQVVGQQADLLQHGALTLRGALRKPFSERSENETVI